MISLNEFQSCDPISVGYLPRILKPTSPVCDLVHKAVGANINNSLGDSAEFYYWGYANPVDSATGSRASKFLTACSGVVFPAMVAATSSEIGSSICSCRASATNAVAVVAPSTSPIALLASLTFRPAANWSPKRLLRDLSSVQVKTRSPRPERPINVSVRPPCAIPKRLVSAKPRVISAARLLAPKFNPSQIPAA